MTRWERKKLKNIERIERGCDEKGKIKRGEVTATTRSRERKKEREEEEARTAGQRE